MIDDIETQLEDRQWLSGKSSPGAEDGTALAGLEGAIPSPDTHPNAFYWYSMVSKFQPKIVESWGGAAPVKKAAQEAPKAAKKADDGAAAATDGAPKAKKEKKEKKPKLSKEERMKLKQEQAASNAKDVNDPCADKFGEKPLNRSQCDPQLRFEKKYTEVKDLDSSLADKVVRVRCRVHNSRAKGKTCFIEGRQGYATVQICLFVGENVSKGMVTFASKLPKESIIEVVASVSIPDRPITGCSQQVELQV